jgi:hypothetical protein
VTSEPKAKSPRRRRAPALAPQVGDAADQGEHGDVAEQEARDDGGGALQLVDGHATLAIMSGSASTTT